MATKWGSILSGLNTGSEMARKRKLEEEDRANAQQDRADRQRQQQIQMDAGELSLRNMGVLSPDAAVQRAETSDEGNNMVKLPSGRFFDPSQSPQTIAKAQQDKTLKQRVAILRAHPQLQGRSDEDLMGLASDEGTFKEVIGQMFKKPEMSVMLDENGKPYVYNKDNPSFSPNFTGKHDPKIGSPEWAQGQTAKINAEFSPEAIAGAGRKAGAIAKAEAPYKHDPNNPALDFRRQNAVSTLRGQFNSDQTMKDAQQVQTAYAKIKASASGPHTATNDMSLIFGVQKMQDPNSTVREGEYATAANAATWPARIRDAYNLTLKNHLLPDETRAQFLQTAETIARAQRGTFGTTIKRYSDIATRQGVDPRDVVYDPYDGLFEDATTGGKPASKAPLTAAQKLRAATDPEYAKFLKDTGRTP